MGLFNTVVLRNQTQGCYMKDLTITGKVLNIDVVSDISDTSTLTSDLFSGDSVNGKTAAGLIGRLEMNNTFNPQGFTTPYNYTFENICVKQLDVETQEYAGGLIGRIKSIKDGSKADTYANALCFTDCRVGVSDLGEEPERYGVTIKGRADVGGFGIRY